MSNWIYEVLLRAEDFLAGEGEHSLSSDIRRLRQGVNFNSMQVYQRKVVEDVADAVLDVSSIDEFQEQLEILTKVFRVDHCTVHLVREDGRAKYESKVITTYSHDWASHYVRSRFSAVDPVVSRCREGAGEFYWDEIGEADPFTSYFFSEANRHGVGPSGFSLTAENRWGDLISVTLAAKVAPAEFRSKFDFLLSDFKDLASLLCDVFTDLTAHSQEERLCLAEEHLQILYNISKGKSRDELESGGFLFGSFRGAEREILRQFNARNLTQAASLAAERGLFVNFPYLEDEIHAGRSELLKHHNGQDRPELRLVGMAEEDQSAFVVKPSE